MYWSAPDTWPAPTAPEKPASPPSPTGPTTTSTRAPANSSSPHPTNGSASAGSATTSNCGRSPRIPGGRLHAPLDGNLQPRHPGRDRRRSHHRPGPRLRRSRRLRGNGRFLANPSLYWADAVRPLTEAGWRREAAERSTVEIVAPDGQAGVLIDNRLSNPGDPRATPTRPRDRILGHTHPRKPNRPRSSSRPDSASPPCPTDHSTSPGSSPNPRDWAWPPPRCISPPGPPPRTAGRTWSAPPSTRYSVCAPPSRSRPPPSTSRITSPRSDRNRRRPPHADQAETAFRGVGDPSAEVPQRPAQPLSA